MTAIQTLWSDDSGFVISSELVLVSTILVIGMVVGLATLRDQVIQELGDVADAFSELNQSYSYGFATGHTSRGAGSFYIDREDFCDEDSEVNVPPECIVLNLPAEDETNI